MAIPFDDYIKTLPKKRQKKIAKRSAELIAEEAALQEIRKAWRHSRASVAKKLKVTQAGASKIESRADMYVSTLRSYIEAMGGKLEITARFPGSPPVHISQFKELE